MTKVNELEAQRIREEQEKVRTIAKENGAIQVIENGGHYAYFKSPNRYAVGAALAKIDTNVVEACEIIFNASVIKEVTDVAYFQQDEVFLSLIAPLQRLILVKKSTLITL